MVFLIDCGMYRTENDATFSVHKYRDNIVQNPTYILNFFNKTFFHFFSKLLVKRCTFVPSHTHSLSSFLPLLLLDRQKPFYSLSRKRGRGTKRRERF